MPARVLVALDGNGDVVGVVRSVTVGALDPVPPGYRDVTAHAQVEAIVNRLKRWTGAAWVDVVPVAPVLPPAVGTLSDRQLLEAIAKQLRLAR